MTGDGRGNRNSFVDWAPLSRFGSDCTCYTAVRSQREAKIGQQTWAGDHVDAGAGSGSAAAAFLVGPLLVVEIYEQDFAFLFFNLYNQPIFNCLSLLIHESPPMII